MLKWARRPGDEAKKGSDTISLLTWSFIPLDVLVSWSINALGAILGAIGEQYITNKWLPGPRFCVFYSKAVRISRNCAPRRYGGTFATNFAKF